MTTFRSTTTSFQQGSRTMPREAYTSEAVLAEERERVFARGWNCVGRASPLAQPGDYMVREVAGESLIVLRDKTGTVRAFFNVCRHRGTRLCREASRRFGETIQCSYHAWTYGTDGRLVGSAHAGRRGLRQGRLPAAPGRRRRVGGFLFVNVAEAPEPFEQAWAPLRGRFARFGIPKLVVEHHVVYDVRANWKLVFQNYSECLHCPTIHPKLASVLPYQSGANDLTEGPFLGGYMEIKAPNESADDGRGGRLVSDDIPADRRRAFYYSLMPNMLFSMHSDYVNYYILRPVAVDRTEVESEWLFHPHPRRLEQQHPRRDRVLGPHEPPGLGHRRAEPARDLVAAVCAGAVLGAGERAGGVGIGSTCGGWGEGEPSPRHEPVNGVSCVPLLADSSRRARARDVSEDPLGGFGSSVADPARSTVGPLADRRHAPRPGGPARAVSPFADPEVELTGAGFYVEFDVPSDAPRGAARFHGRKREHHPEGRERRGGLCSSFGMAAWRPWKATLPRDHGRRNPTPFALERVVPISRNRSTGTRRHDRPTGPRPRPRSWATTAPRRKSPASSTTPFGSSRLAPVS